MMTALHSVHSIDSVEQLFKEVEENKLRVFTWTVSPVNFVSH
jgi:hypothetical protein